MDHTGYVTLTRQSGLLREMQLVANNIANAATTGFRQEGMVFSEYVQRLHDAPSVSMAYANASGVSMMQGTLTETGGQFDIAIEGDGFFLIQTPNGERLTRAGNFAPNAVGDLVTMDGHAVLDAGGAPIFVPPGATDFSVSSDGTISSDGQPLGQIGIFEPTEPAMLRRQAGVMFTSDNGFGSAENPRVLQGFLEGSNVDAISQVARMIQVQRAYEMGQSFLDAENERIRAAIKSLTR
ncbi:flagellar hook-basal body complex protein [Aestuariivita sp.]|uniref:flagellar hook-basal body complex protein n=1 Tax=Aestuariivita sp. TaxID=1872407 RepID=UPI00216C103D|nr:flagellar hook-basal body complex protein [Aestuariivita sp.]MCE8007147.1 flagellar hook-basal body complex protein [Aestuariivita sp.]